MKSPVEINAWQAVEAAGVVLPDELTAMYQRTERIDAELTAVQTAPEVESAVAAVIAGKPVEEAVNDQRAAEAVRDHRAAKVNAAAAASRRSREMTTSWIAANRDVLIVEHLRPVVAEIVAEAVRLVPKLAAYGPDFDGADVASKGSPALLGTWRESRMLDERLGLCRDAWASSWNSATLTVPNGVMVPGVLRVEEPGGIHVWERTEAVEDIEVRDGRVLEVLRIAGWHEAGGYRLASLAEVVEFTERFHTETPWHPGEFSARRVLVPTGKPQPKPIAPGTSWAVSV